MDDLKRTRIRKLACLVPLVVLFGIAFFVLRGPHISNALKRIILPELEMALGRKVIAQKIYVNLFPLFVEARGIKVFDETGKRIFVSDRVKAYADLSGLLRKQVDLRRLVIKEPGITAERKQVEEIADNFKAYLAKVRDTALKVKIRTVEIQKGNVFFQDKGHGVDSDIKGLNAELILGEAARISASAKEFSLKKEGLPEVTGDADLALSFKGDVVEIRKFGIGVLGSRVKGSGEYGKDRGSLATEIELLVASVKNVFGLKGSGTGKIVAKGLINNLNKKPTVDLKLEGNFFLQTLMELLKVRERVEGLIDVKGSVRGPIDNIKGSGTLTLQKGDLFDVDVDLLKCGVTYADGRMSFTNGEGRLYNGSAKLNASINLPVVNYYTLDINFLGVDSKPVFRLIGWDPGVQPGKVNGSLKNAGSKFNPEGSFEYRSLEKGKDMIGRIAQVSGRYKMEGAVVSLAGLKLGTGHTDVTAEGTADIAARKLDFEGELKTNDTVDISGPYYIGLKGSGEFKGKVSGFFDNPVLSGKIMVYNPKLEGHKAELIEADVLYRKNVLEIRDMAVKNNDEQYRMNGDVYFKKAQQLFDMSEPEYNLTGSIRNSGLGKFAKIFYKDFNGDGRLNSDIKIRGVKGNIAISGKASVEKAIVYKIAVDTASFDWSYSGEKLSFTKLKAARGKSALVGEAAIGSDSFYYKASADRILLSDMVQSPMNGDAVLRLKSEGQGTFENPSISVDARIIEGRLKGKPVGEGTLAASIKEKNISVRAGLLNDKVNINVTGRFEKEIPWAGTVDIKPGRYDSVITSFLKDVPEDLLLSLTGTISMHGDRDHIYASSELKQLAFSMYGYSFTNDKEIRLDLNDRQLVFDKVSMRSGNTALRLDGSLVIGKQYNLVIEGNSALSPFKSLSSKIGLLKGDAEFVLGITGAWETPQLNGGVTLINGAFGLKDYSYRVSSLSGYLYMDNDRIVLQKLSGKVGGGDIDISGVVYLKKFAVRGFYVEAGLNNISASVSEDFNVNFGGDILFKGTPASQIISGDIKINRAKYKERVEWKSWLLGAKKAEKYKGEISGLEKAELNIRISGKDNITIDNNVARSALSVDLLLRGTVYRPALLGRLETKEGAVYFRNNEFRIIHASTDFSDPNRINPYIQISADTVIKGYKIKMNLEGQMDHFTMSLSSDPVLKESDILALLTVGRTEEETKGLEGGIGAGEATSFVTGKMQDVVEERLRSITGLDRFQIDPYISKTTGTVEPRVTVSKRLMGEKVFVTYASTVGSTEEQVIKLEYILSKTMSLVGVRDERGLRGGDVRFRFEFK